MLSTQTLRPILHNEAVTRGLGDPEARVLIEWLVHQAERLAEQTPSEPKLASAIDRLCLRARSISRFVALWDNPRTRSAACQLAATERFAWPLPTSRVDPCELMLDILSYESQLESQT